MLQNYIGKNKKGTIKINKKYLYQDFPKMPEITEEVRKENLARKFTGGVRINNGMYRTDREYDEYMEKSLNRKLP